MNPAAFFKKHNLRGARLAGLQYNENSLRDIVCPKCTNREAFTIDAMSTFLVTDDGVEQEGDVEWFGKNRICCRQCDNVGTVKEFTLPGLDETIDALQASEEYGH